MVVMPAAGFSLLSAGAAATEGGAGVKLTEASELLDIRRLAKDGWRVRGKKKKFSAVLFRLLTDGSLNCPVELSSFCLKELAKFCVCRKQN